MLQVAHIELLVVPSSRVVCSLKSPVQGHIALYRTIVYCGMMGNTIDCSLRVTGIGVAG